MSTIPDTSGLLYLIPLSGLFTALVIWRVRAQAAPVGDALRAMVLAEGWSDVSRPSLLGGTVHGRWQGRGASVEYGPPTKPRAGATPSGGSVIAVVEARGPRLVLTPRDEDSADVWTRPIVLTGPPTLDLSHLPIARRAWIRCDDAAFAERVVSDPNTAAWIEAMLNDRATEIVGDGKTVRVMRSVPRDLWGVIPAIVERARETCRGTAAVAAHYQPPR